MQDVTPLPCQATAAPVADAAAQTATLAPATSSKDDVARVKAVAAQFEALMLSQMLKQMRQSVFDDGEDKKAGMEPLADTMYSELGLALSRAGGFGLSDALTGSLMKRAGLSTAGADNVAPAISGLSSIGLALPGGLSGIGTDLAGSSPFAGASGFGLQGIANNPQLPASVLEALGKNATKIQAAIARANGAHPDPAAAAVQPATETPAPDPMAPLNLPVPSPDVAGGSILPPGAISSAYGWRRDPIDGHTAFHQGTDIPMAYGSDVRSASDGRVTFVGDRPGYGLTVEVTHGDHLVTRYAHLSSSTVKVGDPVLSGQVIAASGNSGRSTGPHLHFEVIENGQSVDPQGGAGARLMELRARRPDQP